MDPVMQLSLIQLASAYVFVVIALIAVKARGISRTREILIASVRMTLQLILMGYLLIYLFAHPSPYLTLLILTVMIAFSIFNIYGRIKAPLSRQLKEIIAMAIAVGTTVVLFYFLLIVVGLKPWYEPRYFIPLAGMLIGNSMTGVALGINQLTLRMEREREMIEAALMLGATPREACREIVAGAFDAAIMPTVNSMLGMGIVFLPGMMTGQILSGVSPLTAIQYQIAIMMGILGSVTITVFLAVQLGYKSYFNKRLQWREGSNCRDGRV